MEEGTFERGTLASRVPSTVTSGNGCAGAFSSGSPCSEVFSSGSVCGSSLRVTGATSSAPSAAAIGMIFWSGSRIASFVLLWVHLLAGYPESAEWLAVLRCLYHFYFETLHLVSFLAEGEES